MATLSPLGGLRNKQSLIRDRIRAVVRGHANGIYLHGRPGLSKTYLVRTTLEKLGTRYEYSNGHVTPLGLFELIEKNPNSVIVLDDVSSIFAQPLALQILLAALGSPHDGSKARTVRYTRANGDRVVQFRGSIIAISNLQLAGHVNHVLDALRDRVHVLSYEPSDEEIEASIHEIAGTSPRGVAPKDAVCVAEFLLDACRECGIRPSIRLYVDKALTDFQLWKAGDSESHWTDLVRSSVQQLVIAQEKPLRDISRKEQIDSEQRLVQALCEQYPLASLRVEAWKTRTGKSQAAFYRRYHRLRSGGQLTVC